MNETTKATTRRINDPLFLKIFKGNGIDIGCGTDILDSSAFPKIKSITPFDIAQGDAQEITKFVQNKFDFVHSSQCLEHMRDINTALSNWIDITKSKGYLIITIPDFDLYEQGIWLSRFNPDHKFSFSLSRKNIDRDNHICVPEWLSTFSNVRVIKQELIDTNYDYSIQGQDQTLGSAEAFIEIVLQKK